jgi:hypothetical protein
MLAHMTTYLIHHTPKSANQDTWAVAFSLPYIAAHYARAGDNCWYVKTWLTADQIQKRLAILFDDSRELAVHTVDRRALAEKANITWHIGRLEDDEPAELFAGPRALWQALNSAVHGVVANTAPRTLRTTVAT